MTSVFSIALFAQVLLVLSGLALLQLVTRERVQVLASIPYAWGTGAAILYLTGGLFVRLEWLLYDWHLVVGCAMVALIIAGVIVYLRREPGRLPDTPPLPVPVRWYDMLIIILIVVKTSLVAYICMVNSVMDSDATDMRRYVALAKKIGEGVSLSEVMERGTGHRDPIGPPVLSAWVRMFLDRWHDSVASLPWLLAWLFSGWIMFITCHRLSRHFTASLVCAYLFLSVPLVAIHVFRSGFHDLLVAYFFVAGISILSLAFLSREQPDRTWLVLTATAVVGLVLCKSEGRIWALFLVVMWASYYLHVRKGIPWSKLVLAQVLAGGALVVFHYFFLGEGFFDNLADRRLRLMAPHPFSGEAFAASLRKLFLDGSFGTLWSAVVLSGSYLLLSRESRQSTRALVFFIFSMLLGIFYIANFTENIRFTLDGTNITRFLIQLSGLLLPMYCALILAWFSPPASVQPDESRAGSLPASGGSQISRKISGLHLTERISPGF